MKLVVEPLAITQGAAQQPGTLTLSIVTPVEPAKTCIDANNAHVVTNAKIDSDGSPQSSHGVLHCADTL